MNLFLDVVPISPAAALFNERMAVVLGFITLAAVIAVIVSCRSFTMLLTRLGVKQLLNSRVYRAFYSWHIYYWWIFAMALVLHVMTAITHTTVSGRTDVIFHWWILGLGLASLVALFPVQLSCRSAASFLNVVSGSLPTRNRFYDWFFQRHGALWWPLLFLIAVHIGVSAVHTHWWPTAL